MARMADELLRADLPERGLVAFAAETTETAFEGEWRHLAGRVAAEALARGLTAAALAAGFLTGDEQLSLQIKTEGKLGGLLVDVNARGDLRGYTDVKTLPPMDPGPSAFSYAIGARGKLLVIRSTASAVRYAGTVDLVAGDIASDLERYLEASEQRRSIVELATTYEERITYAGGLLIQAGPGVDPAFFAALEARRTELGPILRAERAPGAVLARVFAGERLAIVERRPLRFRCSCSPERVERMIAGLDPAELADMIEKDHGATITCHFCNDRYELDEAALRRLLEERKR
jgi:molecular chaperone Hsp33